MKLKKKPPTKTIGRGTLQTTTTPTLGEIAARYGITAEQATSMGWHLADATEIQRNFGPYHAGLVIPFHGADGQLSLDPKTAKPYARCRLRNWEGKGKYRAPAGSGIHAYLPPTIDWIEVSRNAKTSLLITEGEAKAACATFMESFPATAGLTGVDCLYNRDGHIA